MSAGPAANMPDEHASQETPPSLSPRCAGDVWIAAALLALLATSLVREIDGPFWGLHDFNTADQSQFARALLRQPPSVHRFLPTYTLGKDVPQPVHHYAHHPPLITTLTALSFLAFGEHAWSARLTALLCSLVGMAFFLLLARESASRRAAWAAGFIYAILPVGAFFGRMTNHEAPALCFTLIALWGWNGIACGASPRRGRAAAWGMGIAAAIYSGWPGTFAAAFMAIQAWFSLHRGRGSLRLALAATLWPAMILSILLIHLVECGMEGHWGVWWALLASRSAGETPPKIGDDPMSTYWQYTAQNFSWPVVLLGGIFLAGQGLRMLGGMRNTTSVSGRTHDRPNSAAVWWIAAALGATHLCFYRQALMHHYWWFYCWPAAAYLAGRGLDELASGAAGWSRLAARIVMAAGLALCFAACAINTNRYFSYRTYDPAKIAFWNDPALRSILDSSGAPSAIYLAEPMIARETQGGHLHWWWGEPATAYYMDRPYFPAARPSDLFATSQPASDSENPARFAGTEARYLVISEQRVVRSTEWQAAVMGVTPLYRNWGFLVYDARVLKRS